MSKLKWDQTGERLYETGVEQVALFPFTSGAYAAGVAWNGVTALNITPSGAEPTPLYANNKKYLTLMSAENTDGTIEAYTYPDEWAECDGSATPVPGVRVGQQPRKTFGLVGKTLIGNDTLGNKYGYRLHLIWGALASVSEKNYATVNESPEAEPFSWEFTTTPVDIAGFEPTAYICVDSTTVDAEVLAALEVILYGKDPTTDNGNDGVAARLPMPDEVLEILGYEPAA